MAGYVYLIGSPTFSWYKIGKSSTPDTRIKQLGILLPFKIEVIAIWRAENHHELEKLLHLKYAEQQINGEWFRFSSKQVRTLLCAMPKSIQANALVFSNVKRDAPDGKQVIFKFKRDDSRGYGAEGRIKDLLADNKDLRIQVQKLQELRGSRVSLEEVPHGA